MYCMRNWVNFKNSLIYLNVVVFSVIFECMIWTVHIWIWIKGCWCIRNRNLENYYDFSEINKNLILEAKGTAKKKKRESKVQGSEHQWLGRSDMIKSSKSCFPSHMLVVWLCQVILETEHLESRPSAFNRVCQRLWAPLSGSNWKKNQNLKRVPQLSACGVSVSSEAWDKIFKVTARLKVQSTKEKLLCSRIKLNYKRSENS